MKVFVTGANGFIGSVLVDRLVAEGHEVTAMVRSEAGAGPLRSKGAKAFIGTLQEPEALAAEAARSDAVVHLAFMHTEPDFAKVLQTDRAVCNAITAALAGSGKIFIGTSGAAALGDRDTPLTEDQRGDADDLMSRASSEAAVLKGGDQGIHAAVVRLPQNVFDSTGSFFSKFQLGKAKETGAASYVEPAADKRINCVHVDDAVDLFVRLLTSKDVAGIFHAADDTITWRELAEGVGAAASLPTRAISPDEAQSIFGMPWAFIFAGQAEMDTSRSRELGWKPTHAKGEFLKFVRGDAA